MREFEEERQNMNAKESVFLKRNLITMLGILAVFALIWFACGIVTGDRFTDDLFGMDSQVQYNELEPEQLQFEFDREDILRLESVEKKDGRLTYTLSPQGRGTVEMSVYRAGTDETLYVTIYRVLPSGTIVDSSTGNFTNHRAYLGIFVLLGAVLAVALWLSFGYVQKVLRYSYQAIFFSGLAIWETLISVLLMRVWYMKDTMLNVYSVLQMAAMEFMLCSFPFMLIFCIALSASNVRLIRKEGFRPRNALGILISVVMIVGLLLNIPLSNSFSSGSDLQVRVASACTGIYSSVYAFMECFLIGAILCGILAAKHEPEYDMDYLVILGCKVRKDGTLYPLLQARVDRAIGFYRKQLEMTGKKAVFVPSGGQGPDETISEAAAMKRYILEQGIPAEQILTEDQSKNTEENMRFSGNLIRERTPDAKVAFSTTNFHVFRSGIISRENQFEPDGMGSKTQWYFWPNAFIREVIGMMAYKWKSIVIVLLPIIVFFIAVQFVG